VKNLPNPFEDIGERDIDSLIDFAALERAINSDLEQRVNEVEEQLRRCREDFFASATKGREKR